MTKVLFWNIENFGLNKIDNPSVAFSAGHGGLADNVASQQRQLVIESALLSTDPEIFIVVEVSTGANAPGTLVTETGGAQGARRLLTILRNLQADWRLVPPIVVGAGGVQESVAIFYRGVTAAGGTRYFTGPNIWSGAATAAPGGPPAVAYVAPWNTAVNPPGVAARAIPGAAGFNAGVNEDRVAARVVPMVYPPAAGPFAANWREPYYCSFFETGGGVANRNISIFAIHAPPTAFGAPVYITAAAQAVLLQPGAGGAALETRVVAGDFNVNLLTAGGADANAYAAFLGFQPLLHMPGAYAGGGAPLSAYVGYATTHIKPKKIFGAQCASFMSTAAAQSTYPGLRYSGSGTAANLYSIDNILVAPPPANLANCQVTVVNLVTGAPYAVLAGLAGTVPNTAAPAWNSIAVPSFFTTVPAGFSWSGAANGIVPLPFALGTNNQCLNWANYGRIRSTSDHFAIYANV